MGGAMQTGYAPAFCLNWLELLVWDLAGRFASTLIDAEFRNRRNAILGSL
jgi:hypothetical protein